jgi:hypothetical protein
LVVSVLLAMSLVVSVLVELLDDLFLLICSMKCNDIFYMCLLRLLLCFCKFN